jgi:hypothetical protein
MVVCARAYATLRRLSAFTTGIGFGKRNTRSGIVLICDDGKDGCVGADADRDRQHGDNREQGIAVQHAQTVTHVTREHIEGADVFMLQVIRERV